MISIKDFFTEKFINDSGSIMALQVLEGSNRKFLYVVNEYDLKLLKIILKNEKGGVEGKSNYAQLKIIRYGFKRAVLWADKPTDPERYLLRDDIEITYHGSVTSEKTSKIHLKVQTRYRTLIDQALDLPTEGIEQPAPLFGLDLGCFSTKKCGDTKTRGGHVVKPGSEDSVRFEFYIMSKCSKLEGFVNSTYFLNMLFSLDYLSVAQKGILKRDQIIAPIRFYSMGDFWLIVKRSVSQYKGQPTLLFYWRSLMAVQLPDGSMVLLAVEYKPAVKVIEAKNSADFNL